MSDSRISIPVSFAYVTLALVLLILIHELGHALVAAWCSVQVTDIVLSGLGGLCGLAGLPATRSQRLMLHAAGYIAQALALFIAACLLAILGPPKSLWATCFTFIFIGMNAIYLVIGLFPKPGNDAHNFLNELRRKQG